MYWRPPATGPPTPSRNGGSIFASAPPSRSSTTPVRTCATRTPSSRRASASPPRPGRPRARKSPPAGPSSSIGSSPRAPVVADRRAAHERPARAAAPRPARRKPRTRLRVPRTRLSRIACLRRGAPALRDVLPGKVHDRVAPGERLRRAPVRASDPSLARGAPYAPCVGSSAARVPARDRARAPSPRRRARLSAATTRGPIRPVAPVIGHAHRALTSRVRSSVSLRDAQLACRCAPCRVALVRPRCPMHRQGIALGEADLLPGERGRRWRAPARPRPRRPRARRRG